MEDRDSDRLTDVVDAVPGLDDDPLGMRIGPGTEVGGYVIDGELGSGGMGVVYSATHPVIGKRAAVKILRLEVSRSPVAVERFIQEARAVNQIGHPNIIDIFAYGALPDGRAYHVMDLLAGESLRRRLKRSVLHPSEAASVIDEIASALIAAHDSGFVHRDLKPDNVFLVSHEGRWPEVKLLDFGLAKLMPEYGIPAFITKTGTMLGTPEYMSPEQARGIGVDYRTDIYALGVVMFEILAGQRPFPPLADSLATLLQHAEEPPASLADLVSGLPDEMVQLVNAMLAKTPEARPSLAAVRTVIKRLRTTQLPTRSVAGLAMASLSQPPGSPSLGISASQLGAQAVLPGDSQVPATRSAPPSDSQAPATRPPLPSDSQVPVTRAPLPSDSQVPATRPPLPQTTTPGVGFGALRWGQGPLQFTPPRPPTQAVPSAGSPSGAPPPSSPGTSVPHPLDPSSPGARPPPSSPSAWPPLSPSSPGILSAPRPLDPSSPGARPPPSSPSAWPPLSPSSPGIPSAPRALDPSSPGVSAPPSFDPSASVLGGPPRPRSPSAPPAPGASDRELPRARSPSAPPAPGASADGMRPASPPLPSTKLGLAPPPRQTQPRSRAPEPAAAAARPRRTWLVLAVLLVIAGAAAIIVSLVGT